MMLASTARPALPGTAAAPRHRDRRGCQDRPQGSDRGQMISLIDPLPHRLRRRDIQRNNQLTIRSPAPHSEASALEHSQHRLVLAHDFGVEPVDPPLRPDRRELLQHPGPDPVPLKIIGHRERDLRHAGLAQPVKAGDRHHRAVVPGDQREPVNATGLNGRARGEVGAPIAVEAKVTAFRRQAVVERLDVPEVRRRRGLQAQRRPIPQQYVPGQQPRPVLRSRRHICCPPLTARTLPMMQQDGCAHKGAPYPLPPGRSRLARDRRGRLPRLSRGPPRTRTARPFGFSPASSCGVSRASKASICSPHRVLHVAVRARERACPLGNREEAPR